MTELPPGWVQTTLGDVASTQLGKMLSSKSKTGVGTTAYLRNSNVQWGRFDLDDLAAMDFSDEEKERYAVKPGDLVVCEGGEVGRCAVWRGPGNVLFQKALHRVRPYGGMRTEFLQYWLTWAATQPWFRRHVTGSTISHLPQQALRQLPLRVPPLAEQNRIVGAIEQRLTRLDAADAALDQAQRRIELLADRLRVRAVHRPNVPEWPLAELSVLVTDGDHRPPPRVPHGVPHLTAKNVKHGRLILDGCSYLSDDGFEQTRRRYEPLEGDVIVTCVGTVGETAVVPPGLVFSADRNLAAVRVGDRLLPEYLREVLATRSMRESLTVASGSTAQPHLYLKDLRRVRIPTPGINEQREVVEQIEREMALVGQLSSALVRGRQRSAQLRRSILQQAFTGRLVPQDPSDVRASAMLDRCHSVPAGPDISRSSRPEAGALIRR